MAIKNMMNNKISFLITCLLLFLGTSYGQNITISWTSTLNCEWVKADSVVVMDEDLSYEERRVFYYPDTMIVLNVNKIKELSQYDATLNIYPNPSKGYANIKYTNNKDGYVNMKVVTMDGKVILSKEQYLESGTSHFTLSIANKGVYVVVFQSQGSTIVKKIINIFQGGSNDIIFNKKESQYNYQFAIKNNNRLKSCKILEIRAYYTSNDSLMVKRHYVNTSSDTGIVFSFFDKNGIDTISIVDYAKRLPECIFNHTHLYQDRDFLNDISVYNRYGFIECNFPYYLVINNQSMLDSIFYCDPDSAYINIDFKKQSIILVAITFPNVTQDLYPYSFERTCDNEYYLKMKFKDCHLTSLDHRSYFLVVDGIYKQNDIKIKIYY